MSYVEYYLTMLKLTSVRVDSVAVISTEGTAIPSGTLYLSDGEVDLSAVHAVFHGPLFAHISLPGESLVAEAVAGRGLYVKYFAPLMPHHILWRPQHSVPHYEIGANLPITLKDIYLYEVRLDGDGFEDIMREFVELPALTSETQFRVDGYQLATGELINV